MGFPGGSDGKETACNVGDLGSILGLGRSPEGGHGMECNPEIPVAPGEEQDRKSTRLNSSHSGQSRMPSSA